MELLPLIINLVSGAVGGNVAGGLLKNFNQGTLINSIAGIVGGGLGGSIITGLTGIGTGAGGMDIGSIIGTVASGGVGGGVLLVIVGIIRQALGK